MSNKQTWRIMIYGMNKGQFPEPEMGRLEMQNGQQSIFCGGDAGVRGESSPINTDKDHSLETPVFPDAFPSFMEPDAWDQQRRGPCGEIEPGLDDARAAGGNISCEHGGIFPGV